MLMSLERRRSSAVKRISFLAAEARLSGVPRVESQVHTSWTDGTDSVGRMYEAANTSGLASVVFSEHSSLESRDWFTRFAAEVDDLTRLGLSCSAICGTEVRISSLAGDLDLDPLVRTRSDLVLASVHRFPDRFGKPVDFAEVDSVDSVEIEKNLMKSALSNPAVDVLSHPFGMSIVRFGADISVSDWVEVIQASKEAGVVFEINSKYHRDPIFLLELCGEISATVTLGSDAHNAERVGECSSFLAAKFGERKL